MTEGLPLWDQPLVWAVITVAVPIVGLIGTVTALRRCHAEQRERWLLLLAVLVPTLLLSCLVNRCAATANALALPGAAWLLLAMLTRARRVRNASGRTLATAGALLVASPGPGRRRGAQATSAHACPAAANPRAHGAPPATASTRSAPSPNSPPASSFYPSMVTPDLIATTPHQGVSAGYHRNTKSMNKVLEAFTGDGASAERIVRASGARYVAGCPNLNETRLYDATSPYGLWARLERGETFAWLVPVPINGSPVLAWRVVQRR